MLLKCGYLCVFICSMCLYFIHHKVPFQAHGWFAQRENSDTDVWGYIEGGLTLSPSDPGLEWLNKQVLFPNCVWRMSCARCAAVGPMAGAKRVHFVQHTRRIWRADVLSAAIQLHTQSSALNVTKDHYSWSLKSSLFPGYIFGMWFEKLCSLQTLLTAARSEQGKELGVHF